MYARIFSGTLRMILLLNLFDRDVQCILPPHYMCAIMRDSFKIHTVHGKRIEINNRV